MRQVDACDFCGESATGLFEPLPASAPESPRLALCAGCRDRLESVVDPLLAMLDDDGARPAAEPAPGGESGSEPDGSGRPAPDGSGASTAHSSPEPDVPATDSVADAEVGESRDAGGRSKASRRGTPRGYRKAMRFLENRQLPVERSEAEFLVSEAYELDEDEVAAVIDHAVQYGRLREVDGELTR